MTIKEMTQVMLAYEAGARIECKSRVHNDTWEYIPTPAWNWSDFNYRVKPKNSNRPFKDAAEAADICGAHGNYIKSKFTGVSYPIQYYWGDALKCYVGDIFYDALLESYEFGNGDPCGIKVSND